MKYNFYNTTNSPSETIRTTAAIEYELLAIMDDG